MQITKAAQKMRGLDVASLETENDTMRNYIVQRQKALAASDSIDSLVTFLSR